MIYGMMDGYLGDEPELDALEKELEYEREQYREQVLLHTRYSEDF